MKFTILVLFLVSLWLTNAAPLTALEFTEVYSPVIDGKVALPEEHIRAMYQEFLVAFKGVKETEVSNHYDRYPIFAQNLRGVVKHNQDLTQTWKKGINEFSDMTEEEFFDHFRIHLNANQNCSATSTQRLDNVKDLPTEFNWRNVTLPHGAKVVTPVKNQGKCGSCWTFSTIGAMESHYALASTKFGNFSEQQLVDCAGAYNNFGCSGGLPSYAFNYIRDNKLTFESRYPYTAVDGKCYYNPTMGAVTTTGPWNITAGDEDELAGAIHHHGPVSVAFQVVNGFKDYASGVYTSSVCKNSENDVNHAVLAVGFGVENGLGYFDIKNSWGATWGNQGFFRIQRGVNMCGIAMCNSFPQNVRDIWSNPAELLLKSE